MVTAADVLTMIVALYAHDRTTPPRSAPAFAEAIAHVVEQEPAPIGWKKIEAAALLVVTAKGEGNFCTWNCRRGDRGKSVCTFQVMTSSRKRRRLLEKSIPECARAGYAAMRASVITCPLNPLAQYAGGCDRPRAKQISARRIEEAIFLTLPE